MSEYLVPDYFPSFACKMGACRHACCEGWPISFSMEDYFRLLSVDCSPELRRKLDGALHLKRNASPEAYAEISPRWDGQCPLHMEDGRCMLHAELGGDALAAVCRLYPRGVRQRSRECSCANSCEATLELLLHREAPITFIPHEMTCRLPVPPPRTYVYVDESKEQAVRLWLIRQLQQRGVSLPHRLVRLGCALLAMDQAIEANVPARIDRLLSDGEPFPMACPDAPDREHLLSGMASAERMLAIMNEGSNSIRDLGESVLRYFGQGEDALNRYEAARDQFAALLPDWETWFEHMLVNHMYFSQFPFQDRPVPLKDEFLALCAAYALVRFLCVGQAAQHPSVEAVVDAAAAAFRLVQHTEFDRYAAHLLRKLGCDEQSALWSILAL